MVSIWPSLYIPWVFTGPWSTTVLGHLAQELFIHVFTKGEGPKRGKKNKKERPKRKRAREKHMQKKKGEKKKRKKNWCKA